MQSPIASNILNDEHNHLFEHTTKFHSLKKTKFICNETLIYRCVNCSNSGILKRPAMMFLFSLRALLVHRLREIAIQRGRVHTIQISKCDSQNWL